jgi:hypothetical protein
VCVVNFLPRTMLNVSSYCTIVFVMCCTVADLHVYDEVNILLSPL